MTIRQKLEARLVLSGMFPAQAVEVLDATIADPANVAMVHGTRSRWEDDAEGYPPALLAVLCVSMDRHALAWIDANCPKAWYRPLFSAGDYQ